jgi:uncharacterized SAM-binding protein YcdF (DUF218 family)
MRESVVPRRFGGLLSRKERWGLSLRGWFLFFASGLIAVGWFVFGSYPFLAITEKTDANLLVVEGWVHDYAIRMAVDEFRTAKYERVFTTGGPVIGMGGYTNQWNTSASVGADRLKAAGVPAEYVQMVPARAIETDRTYTSALALRAWCKEHDVEVRSMNIITDDVHARRTQLLFAKAFGKGVRVGIIAARNPDYPPELWWRYSEGARDVIGESIAWLYARFVFAPLH